MALEASLLDAADAGEELDAMKKAELVGKLTEVSLWHVTPGFKTVLLWTFDGAALLVSGRVQIISYASTLPPFRACGILLGHHRGLAENKRGRAILTGNYRFG